MGDTRSLDYGSYDPISLGLGVGSFLGMPRRPEFRESTEV